MSEKELYELYELCMFDVFTNIIKKIMVVQIILKIQGSHRNCAKKLQI